MYFVSMTLGYASICVPQRYAKGYIKMVTCCGRVVRCNRILLFSVSHNFIAPSKELCSKMALGEIVTPMIMPCPCPSVSRLLKTIFKFEKFVYNGKMTSGHFSIGQS